MTWLRTVDAVSNMMPLLVIPENIPDELKAHRAWAYWRYVPRPYSAKPAKKPFDALTDRAADSTLR